MSRKTEIIILDALAALLANTGSVALFGTGNAREAVEAEAAKLRKDEIDDNSWITELSPQRLRELEHFKESDTQK